jgi:hypothetical protein
VPPEEDGARRVAFTRLERLLEIHLLDDIGESSHG